LGLEAAGAVERLLRRQVALDLGLTQGAEADPGGVLRLQPAAIAEGQAQRGVEQDFAAGHRRQLGPGAGKVPWFAQRRALELGDLVGAQDPGIARAVRHRACLGARKSTRLNSSHLKNSYALVGLTKKNDARRTQVSGQRR